MKAVIIWVVYKRSPPSKSNAGRIQRKIVQPWPRVLAMKPPERTNSEIFGREPNRESINIHESGLKRSTERKRATLLPVERLVR